MERQQLIDFLRSDLRVDVGKLDDDSALFSSGAIDSFAVVSLIVFMEKQAGFKMPPLDVNLDNLDSVNRILSYVQRRTQSQGA